MLVLLSPAKTLDFESEAKFDVYTYLAFADKASYLVTKLKKLSVNQLRKLMNISEDLARLNVERYNNWALPFNHTNAKQAIYAFNGDVYDGLNAHSLKKSDLNYAQKHLRILSGLYGVIRPTDLIQPYRLEMGTTWNITAKKKNLYSFWRDALTNFISEDIKNTESKYILNLASVEYAKALNFKALKAKTIVPRFKEERNGKFQMISFFAKKARGLMAAYVLQNRITEPEDLKAFDREGYTYNERLSNSGEHKWVFSRKPQLK